MVVENRAYRLIFVTVCWVCWWACTFASNVTIGKWAVATLMKGMKDVSHYKALIDRNKSIRQHLYSPPHSNGSMDVIIFHEGDVTATHQEYIQKESPDIPLMFINISSTFNKWNDVENPICPHSYLSRKTEPGYINMCTFWFAGYLEYMQKYDFLFRFDADCVLITDIRGYLFSVPASARMGSTRWLNLANEKYDRIAGPNKFGQVSTGMHQVTTTFAREHQIFDTVYTWYAPYTNVFFLDLHWVRNSTIIAQYTNTVLNTNCINSNRWGDMPLWGANALLTKQTPFHLKVPYYHGSHNAWVNSE